MVVDLYLFLVVVFKNLGSYFVMKKYYNYFYYLFVIFWLVLITKVPILFFLMKQIKVFIFDHINQVDVSLRILAINLTLYFE